MKCVKDMQPLLCKIENNIDCVKSNTFFAISDKSYLAKHMNLV